MTTQELLIQLGVVEPALSELEDVDHDTVMGWLRYIRTQDSIQNPAGYLITQLREGRDPPPVPNADRLMRQVGYSAYADYVMS